jgi:hypothetical protein
MSAYGESGAEGERRREEEHDTAEGQVDPEHTQLDPQSAAARNLAPLSCERSHCTAESSQAAEGMARYGTAWHAVCPAPTNRFGLQCIPSRAEVVPNQIVLVGGLFELPPVRMMRSKLNGTMRCAPPLKRQGPVWHGTARHGVARQGKGWHAVQRHACEYSARERQCTYRVQSTGCIRA